MLILGLAGCASDNRPALLIAGDGPVYPEFARVQQIQGYVTVAYDVTLAGKVVNARVVDAQPAQVFNSAALEAVRSWQFLPTRRNGAAVAVTGQLSTLTFKQAEELTQHVERNKDAKQR